MITGIIILGGFHHKNKIGLSLICDFLHVPLYQVQNIDEVNNINNANVLIVSDSLLQPYLFNKRFIIHGPHFESARNSSILYHNDVLFNTLCEWNDRVHRKSPNFQCFSTYFPFPVDVQRFIPGTLSHTKSFLYIKLRNPNLIQKIKSLFQTDFIIEYGKYNETEYIEILKQCKYGIWFGRHESQGFALEECLSMNIPLFIIDVQSQQDEEGCTFDINDLDCGVTAAPYWNDIECGLKTYYSSDQQILNDFSIFQHKIDTYSPRNFILKNLDVEPCINQIYKSISSYSPVLFCISSMIYTPNTALSYTNTRSVFTKEQRLQQTVETIKSIRKHCPYAYIAITESSELSQNDKQLITSNGCDEIYLVQNTSYANSTAKGTGEFWSILEYLQQCKIRFFHFFKISGRYRLNDQFNINNWIQHKNQGNYGCTVLYKIFYQNIERYISLIQNNLYNPDIINGSLSIEYSTIFENFNTQDILGVEGEISVNGEYWKK